MRYIKGQNREQATMFPEVLDDYVGENNPVRFIDAYVDGLDWAAMGFTYSEPKETGRKPHNPGKSYTFMDICTESDRALNWKRPHTRTSN